MKIILVILFSVITFTVAQEFVTGRKVIRRYGRAFTDDQKKSCENANMMTTFCGNTDPCEKGSIFTCVGGTAVEADVVSCPDDKPYCIGDPGSQFCSTKPDSSCVPICKIPGYVPDPSNCLRFYYCYLDDKKTIKSELRECPPGAPFNLAGPQDRKCQVAGACLTQKCTAGLTAEWRPFNYNGSAPNQVALKCINGNPDHVHQCANGLSLDQTFTPYSKCFLYCTSSIFDSYRKAVNPLEKTKYYQCINGVATNQTCEVAQNFNPTTLNCEKAA